MAKISGDMKCLIYHIFDHAVDFLVDSLVGGRVVLVITPIDLSINAPFAKEPRSRQVNYADFH